MLKSIRLRNFKCFKDSGYINLSPLTLFCGTNSSGKTTLLQSILMLKQSFESNIPFRNIILNGRFTHLGSFENVIHEQNIDNEFFIDLKLLIYPFQRILDTRQERRSPIGIGFMYNRFLRGLHLGIDRKELKEKEGECYLYLSYGFKYPKNTNIGPNVNTIKLEIKSFINKNNQGLSGTRIELSNIKSKRYILKWNDLRSRYWYSFDEILKSKIKQEKTFECLICGKKHRYSSHIGESHFRKAIFKEGEIELDLVFENMVPHIQTGSQQEYLNQEYGVLLNPFRNIKPYLAKIFESYHYLGPLREEPSRRYIYEEEPVEIGKKGENAPFLLNLEEDKIIDPFYIIDKKSKKWKLKDNIMLSQALNIWLNYLDISQKYNIESLKEIVYFYLIPDENIKKQYSLADVGFGVSQIIPILIEGLRSRVGHTLIFEQPEIHLHPKMQMLLADFFVSLLLSGKILIIETHSDHIINRLVRRIVEDEKYNLSEKIDIRFIDKVKGMVKIKPIEIDETRGIVNWPKDFFVQSAEEKMKTIEASIEKRKKKKKD